MGCAKNQRGWRICLEFLYTTSLSVQFLFFSGQLEDGVVKMDILLRERNFGVMENKPLADYLKTAKSAGFKKPHQFTPEGGESALEVRQRVKNFMKVNFEDIDSVSVVLGDSLGESSYRVSFSCCNLEVILCLLGMGGIKYVCVQFVRSVWAVWGMKS